MPHAVKQAAPVTPELLIKISKVVNYRDQVEMVAWVGVLLGFYMFLRKSNLVPDTMNTFDKDYQFTRADMNLLGLDKAMMFEIRWSKTIQYRQKVLRLPVLPANNKAICPVFWTPHGQQNTRYSRGPCTNATGQGAENGLISKPITIQTQKVAVAIRRRGCCIFIALTMQRRGHVCLPVQYGRRYDKITG